MKEKEAKRQLRRMFQAFTTGSILHLLGDLHRDAAETAQETKDLRLRDQH